MSGLRLQCLSNTTTSAKEFDMSNDILEKPALDVLLDNNLHNLVQATASRYYSAYGRYAAHSVMISQENLAQEGYVGLTVSYDSFDPNLGHTKDVAQSFRTHCYPYIKNAMLTYCRKYGHALSISEKAARDEFKDIISIGVVHMDQLDEDEEFDLPIGSGMESFQEEDYLLEGFSEFERSLVRDNMIDGYSLQEISERHSVSKSRAGEILRRLTERMRIKAENYDQNN